MSYKDFEGLTFYAFMANLEIKSLLKEDLIKILNANIEIEFTIKI